MDLLKFRYAELGKSGSRDYVYFYAFNPVKDKLERVRYYLNNISDTNRNRYAKKLIREINDRLDNGWNPFITDKEKKKFTPIREALAFVLKFKLMYIKERSAPNYRQRMKALTDWLEKKKVIDKPLFEFNEDIALEYMNHLIFKENIKGRTFNNYLIDYRTFFNTLIKQKYISSNPFHAVQQLPETETTKRPFTQAEQERYKKYVLQNDYDFYITSMYCYYCALRPNEITQLRVDNVDLVKGVITVDGDKSKNRKKRIIPIFGKFLEELKIYLEGYPKDFYLVGKGFKPGSSYIYPTRIAEHFREIAIELKIPDTVYFYSLKDTCADRLLDSGFNIKTVRDLFGHSSIAITDEYLKRFRSIVDQKLITHFPEF